MTKKARRTQRGSAIVGGACLLVLITTIGVGITFLVLLTGIGIFFENKVSFVTAQAAQYAAAQYASNNQSVEAETQAFVHAVMQTAGLDANQVTVTVAQTTLKGVLGEQVTVAKTFPLWGTRWHLPTQIRLSDTEFASVIRD